jgi:hypothetical protein
MDQEPTPTRSAANEGKAQEGEGFWLAQPALLSPGRRLAAELQQSGLLRMQRQRESR